MFGDVIRRVVLLIAFLVAIGSLIVNLARGRSLAFSAYWAFWVLFGVAIVLFFAARSISKILMVYLFEQQQRRALEAAAAEDAAEQKKLGKGA